MNHIGNAGSFLIETIFTFCLYLALLRFWMQWVHASFRNPIAQVLLNITNPIVIPLRKILPPIDAIDTATVVLAIAIAFVKVLLLFSIVGAPPQWLPMLLYAIGEAIRASVILFMVAIFIMIIMSWINPYAYHPALEIARALSEPILAPVRRILPSLGGLDLSPIVVFLFLQLTLILVVAPLQSF